MPRKIVLRVQPSVALPWNVHDSDLFEDTLVHDRISAAVTRTVGTVKTVDGVDETEIRFTAGADDDAESVYRAKRRLLEAYREFIESELKRITALAMEAVEAAEKDLERQVEKMNGSGI